MAPPSIQPFNTVSQLTFYGAYHNNKVNVWIHTICVPILLWTAQVFMAKTPTPSFFPQIHERLNPWMSVEFNWVAVTVLTQGVYYLILEPVAALLYLPQLILFGLTATSFAQTHPNAIQEALVFHIVAWIAQFVGHGKFEGRAPTLMDNMLQAFVLAPFFVHVETLFALGYNPKLHHAIQEDVSKELSRIKSEEGKKKN